MKYVVVVRHEEDTTYDLELFGPYSSRETADAKRHNVERAITADSKRHGWAVIVLPMCHWGASAQEKLVNRAKELAAEAAR